MKIPSAVGEAAAVIAVIDFIYWAAANTPRWALWIWIIFGVIFILDWMFGGVSDKGIFKSRQRRNIA